jgi:glycyl-tRNA synthetase beta chain
LSALLADAVALFAGNSQFKDPSADVKAFIIERFRHYLKEQAYDSRAIEAVLVVQNEDLRDVIPRLEAVTKFLNLPQAAFLIDANKRISKIVAKADTEGPTLFPNEDWHFDRQGIRGELFNEPAEIELYELLKNSVTDRILQLADNRDYLGILLELSNLNDPISKFFAEIFVMSETYNVRVNRVTLLNSFWIQFKRVADLSVI